MSRRTPQPPAAKLTPKTGGGGRAPFDLAATLRRIEAVLAELEGAGARTAAKEAPEPPPKRIGFDWG